MRLVTFDADGARRLGVALHERVIDLRAVAAYRASARSADGHGPALEAVLDDMMALLRAGDEGLETVPTLLDAVDDEMLANPNCAYDASTVRLLAPLPRPGTILCIGLNYRDHVLEQDGRMPERPILFVKPANTVIGPGDGIIYPTTTQELDYEAELVVVKAQVQVGGRGKAGGIRRADNADEVWAHATAILGMDIKGHVVKRLWIEQASDIAREYYASFTLDRRAKLHLGIVSARGGVDIEQVAAEGPDAIARQHINPLDGLTEDAARHLVDAAGLDDAARAGAVAILHTLYRCFAEGDADLTEINPLILTRDGAVLALDAKVSLDPSAAFRHPEWAAFEAAQVLDEREQLAREKGLIYIGLDGSVGIIGNGAGLVMSTLDVVTQVGGRAANFLDLGGGANADVVSNALEVINTDENVRSILLNIFGGITRGDEVAKGIIAALERVDVRAPIVIRLDGTNADQGRALLDGYASDRLISRPTMVEAARTAVQLAGGGR